MCTRSVASGVVSLAAFVAGLLAPGCVQPPETDDRRARKPPPPLDLPEAELAAPTTVIHAVDHASSLDSHGTQDSEGESTTEPGPGSSPQAIGAPLAGTPGIDPRGPPAATAGGVRPPLGVLREPVGPTGAVSAPSFVAAPSARSRWVPTPTDPFGKPLRGVRISGLEIDRRNVFGPDQEPQWLLGIFNELHMTTRERVIRQELLLDVGRRFQPELAEESERILRRLDFIADARVYPVPQDDGSVVLRVETQDRFTLRVGGSVGVFSGASTSRFSLGEGNLFGLGKELTFKYRKNDEERRTGVSYKDPQFLGSYHVFRTSLENTDEGNNGSVSIELPFRTLQSRVGYSVRVQHLERDLGYFRFGDTVAEVPNDLTAVDLSYARGYGPRERRLKFGMRARYADNDFGPAFGPEPDIVEVPGDTKIFEIGPTASIEYFPRFAKRMRIDSIGVIEDVPLGWSLSAFAGLQRRSEQGRDVRHETVLSLDGTYSAELSDRQLLTLSAGARERVFAGETQGWFAKGSLHWYYQGFSHQTLAVSAVMEAIGEREGLLPQLTLGEDNGLRGYTSRFFAGDRRFRLNVEDRIFPEWEILSVNLGLVAFFDAGLAWNHGDSVDLSDVHRSVGVGLRLGSAQLIRRDVVRLDLAFPLDDHPEEDFSASVSISVGQVFDIFGNSEALDSQY